MRVALLVAACLMVAASRVSAADAPEAPPIADSRARDYVGQDVTIEGRVTAIHESPLATVIGFAPNFAGFTATILPADRPKFPSDLGARVRDRLVRVTGTVTAYRGKPEMALRDPSQLNLAPAPGPGSVAAHPPVAPAATPDPMLGEIRRALARIEGRLESIEARVTAVEQAGGNAVPPDDDDAVPAARR